MSLSENIRHFKAGYFPKELSFWDRVKYCYYEIKDKIKHLPVFRQIDRAWYYSKCALWKKYNRIHVKSLPPTWVDRDVLLEHAMFQVLEDFILRENIDEVIDWNWNEEHRQARAKMTELMDWWKNVYLKFDSYEGLDISKVTPLTEKIVKNKDGFITLKSNEYEDEFNKNAWKKEKQMSEELKKKMKEIVDIHHYFWT